MTRLDPAAAKPSAAPDELATLDATGLAAAIRARRLSPTEALDAAIARIEALNPRINAVVRKRYEQARTELAEVAPDARFASVPMLIKDVVIAGEPFYNGNEAAAAHRGGSCSVRLRLQDRTEIESKQFKP
jgi:Asp-tRNA(Asn)/Glu-tRNA(Gln) amidotransferase A subunit family amidase